MLKKGRIKFKWENLPFFVLFISFAIVFAISILKTINWYREFRDTTKQVENIIESTEVLEVDNNSNTEIINKDKKNNPYRDYIEMYFIDVDLKKLKEVNSDTVGWIKVNGTNINYPFVKGKDNNYYLTHSFNKNYNKAGWLFLDYRNSVKEMDKNTIIYAHGRSDGTMFGSLKNVLTDSWLENPVNYLIRLSTEYENTSWKIFSVYHIETTSDYLQTIFSTDEEFLAFSNKLKKRSMYDFKNDITKDDKILTLSTCFNDKEKLVVHAKLVKSQRKNS